MSIEPWLFQVTAHPEDSLGHFLGRFRRANHLKSSHLSALLGLRYRSVSYWEAPSRRRSPTAKDLEALSRLTGVDVAQLRLMMILDRTLYLRTRLCAQCYGETPIHKVRWQDARVTECDRHQCPLLCTCPQCKSELCKSEFQLPSCWTEGQCDRCDLPFMEMINP